MRNAYPGCSNETNRLFVMAFAIVIQCYNQSKYRVFDIEEGNGLSDPLHLLRTLLLDRKKSITLSLG